MTAPFAVLPVVRNNATSEVAVSRRKLQKLWNDISCLQGEVELIAEQGAYDPRILHVWEACWPL